MKLFSHTTEKIFLLALFIALGMLPLTSGAATFFTDLEAVAVQTNPAATTTVNNNSLSADFTGGTIDSISIGSLYFSGVISWMVAPNGDTAPQATGVSTGTGTITLSEPAENVLVHGRNEAFTTVAVVRLIDTNDMLINSAISLTDTAWTTIDVTRMQGETLIAKIELEVQSGTGTGMAALDDLTFITPAIVGNVAPVADAGADQNVSTGETVTLDGSGSSDANGDTLTYQWTLSSTSAYGPSAATILSSTTVVNPLFIADIDGNLVFNLVVNDGTVNSAVDSVTITVALSGGGTATSSGSSGSMIMLPFVSLLLIRVLRRKVWGIFGVSVNHP